jgi:hypothetical protein
LIFEMGFTMDLKVDPDNSVVLLISRQRNKNSQTTAKFVFYPEVR